MEVNMKLRKIGLSLVLCLCSVFAVFGLTGCGEVSLETINKNFTTLEETYSKYSTIFTSGSCSGMDTKYLVSYGSVVDNFVNDKTNYAEYAELKDLYNATLVISNDYIDNNKGYIQSLSEDKLDKNMKSVLQKLNNTMVDYTKAIDDFVSARSNFVSYFEVFPDTPDDNASLAHLRQFKKAYGKFVSKNMDFSTKMAETIENTEIFDIIKSTTPTENDTKIIKDYIRAKLLPIFSEFKITEIANNFNWNVSKETETKTRINNLLTALNVQFENYKSNFVSNTSQYRTLTKDESVDEVAKIFDYSDTFFTEADAYFDALTNLNIAKLAVEYGNNLEEYKETNAFAEIYLEKLEQFVENTLPTFMTQIVEMVYA